MKAQVLLIMGIFAVVFIAGCTQTGQFIGPMQTREEVFSENDFEFVSINWDLSPQACDNCNYYKQGRYVEYVIHPCTSAKAPFTLFFNKTILNYENIPSGEGRSRSGYRAIECRFYVDGYDMIKKDNSFGPNEPGYHTFELLPGFNLRFDEDHIIEICCEGICKSRQLNRLCDEYETTELETCERGFTDEYMCSSVYSLRKYQREDCSYEWIKWKHCGEYYCKMEDKNAVCDYENRNPAFKDVGFCKYSQLEAFEDNGLWTTRSISHEYADTISDRARIGIPLLIQGSMTASYGQHRNNLTKGICNVENGQVNIRIYKNDLELFFDSVMTNEYGDWESEKFIPREMGYYTIVMSWLSGNADSEEGVWKSAEDVFHVSK